MVLIKKSLRRFKKRKKSLSSSEFFHATFANRYLTFSIIYVSFLSSSWIIILFRLSKRKLRKAREVVLLVDKIGVRVNDGLL